MTKITAGPMQRVMCVKTYGYPRQVMALDEMSPDKNRDPTNYIQLPIILIICMRLVGQDSHTCLEVNMWERFHDQLGWG
jgi:hypothetical protein